MKQETIIGVAAALGVLFANILEPRLMVVIALAALLWLFVRTPRADAKRAAWIALIALVSAAAVRLLLG